MLDSTRPDSFQVDPDLLRAFAATVRHGSISAGAAALGVSRPTLSRRLSLLEGALGVALLHRSTRRVLPTPAGQRLFERVGPALSELAAAARAVRDEGERVTGRVRVSVPPVLAAELAVVLCDLQRAHPELSVHLVADIGRADLTADGVELAVRAGQRGRTDLVQRRLGTAELFAVAAPALLAAHPAPRTPVDLAALPLLLGPAGEGGVQRWWPLRDGGRLPVSGRFSSNDQHALLAAARAGVGVALVSASTAGDALASGALRAVLPGQVGATMDLHLVFARRTLQPLRVRVTADALVAWAERRDAPVPGLLG